MHGVAAEAQESSVRVKALYKLRERLWMEYGWADRKMTATDAVWVVQPRVLIQPQIRNASTLSLCSSYLQVRSVCQVILRSRFSFSRLRVTDVRAILVMKSTEYAFRRTLL